MPAGAVLLGDASVLAEGFQNAIARLIQQQLGYRVGGRLRKESQTLSAMILVGISEGSGILECETLPANERIEIRDPVSVAAQELVLAIETYNRTRSWPPNLPAPIRNKFGQAIAPVIASPDDSNTITITVRENGTSLDCYIDSSVEEALRTPDDFSTFEPVEIVGQMYDINKRSRSFKLEAGHGAVEVRFGEHNFTDVDRLRWEKVFVSGFPIDERCRVVENISILRMAEASDEEGITLPSTAKQIEENESVVYAKDRAEEFRSLCDDWDSYGAISPSKSAIDFAIDFLRDAVSMSLAYGFSLPKPFFVPTTSGGVQLEWEVSDRELEIEIPRPNEFRYLRTFGESSYENAASRWETMRLLRWVVTGDNA